VVVAIEQFSRISKYASPTAASVAAIGIGEMKSRGWLGSLSRYSVRQAATAVLPFLLADWDQRHRDSHVKIATVEELAEIVAQVIEFHHSQNLVASHDGDHRRLFSRGDHHSLAIRGTAKLAVDSCHQFARPLWRYVSGKRHLQFAILQNVNVHRLLP
jgi:hypothetical protein